MLALTSGEFKRPEIITEAKGQLGRLFVLSTEGTHVQGYEPRRKLLEHMLKTHITPEIRAAKGSQHNKVSACGRMYATA